MQSESSLIVMGEHVSKSVAVVDVIHDVCLHGHAVVQLQLAFTDRAPERGYVAPRIALMMLLQVLEGGKGAVAAHARRVDERCVCFAIVRLQTSIRHVRHRARREITIPSRMQWYGTRMFLTIAIDVRVQLCFRLKRLLALFTHKFAFIAHNWFRFHWS